MSPRQGVKRVLRSGLVVVVLATLLAGITAGVVLAKSSTYESLRIFSEVLQLVQSNYVEEVNSEELLQGSIRGMLRTLDPHTSFMPPEMFKEMQVETEGSFGGLGIEITVRDDQLTVVAPISGTPADRAGIMPDDRIIKVDGQLTKNLTLLDAVRRMRGPKGTSVTITVRRPNEFEAKDFTLTRDVIPIRSVRAELLEKTIGYVRLTNFQKTSTDELDKALQSMRVEGMTSIILDLRNNPGGLLNQAVAVAERFLPKGTLIVTTKGRKANQDLVYRANYDGIVYDEPMIALVNAGSASAAEIVGGALQDHNRAVLIGERSFGKGSVQTILPLSNGSGLRLTTARYYTPSGRVIHNEGITPSIVVALKPAAKPEKGSPQPPVIRERDLERRFKGLEEEQVEPEEPQGEQPAGEAPGAQREKKKETTSESDGDKAKPRSRRDFSLDLEKDVQLRRAVELLKSWQIFMRKQPGQMTTKAEAQ
ncbi:MAG: S41 family peptidase [Candidatus Tectomicrobia bacterium]|nr:S41 family peptidase [Candidatus Tectomicrobia bacterium]